MPASASGFNWFSVLRIGIVQTAIGAMLVLMT